MSIKKLKKELKKYDFFPIYNISDFYLAKRNYERSKKIKQDNKLYFMKKLHKIDFIEEINSIKEVISDGKILLNTLSKKALKKTNQTKTI